MRRFVAVLFSVLLFLVPASPAAFASVGAPAPEVKAAPAASTVPGQVFAAINQYRAGKGLPTLAWNDGLGQVAQRWSQTMVDRSAFVHNPDMGAQAPAGWMVLSENIALNSTASGAMAGWRNSPVHHAMMLSNSHTVMGVGSVFKRAAGTGANQHWITVNFAYYPNPAGGAPPAVTRDPAAVSVAAGATATLSASAAGAGLRYQWEQHVPNSARGNQLMWLPVLGGNAPTLRVGNAQVAQAVQYRLRVSNARSMVVSKAAQLTVGGRTANTAPPVITAAPQPVTTAVGASATFTVGATGSPTPTYAWQYSYNGTTWVDIPNSNVQRMTLNQATLGMNNMQMRVIVSNSAGRVVSAPVRLTVTGGSAAPSAPRILTQPTSLTTRVGGATSFTVVVTGSPAPTYTWQHSRDGRTWTPIAGSNFSTVNLGAATKSLSGLRLRVVVSNASGTATSSPVTLTVN